MKRENSSPAELHRRAREVFLQARERPGTDRERYLRESCGEDEVLRGEVESLLSFDGAGGSPVDRPFLGAEFVLPEAPELCSDVPTENPESGDTPSRPEHIGRYTVIDEIGRGGMGIVYLAEQPLTERRVAIKILNRSSPRRLQRFELEAQILGFLKHPGIAQIYEAGTTDLGTGRQMFFAMEFVEGPPITDFAAQRRLSIPERIELLARVCDGVQHAHDRGVLHLDLKPDNVLVDESGAPKVLDFGVARFEEAVGELGRADQEPGHVVGTPAYMSPEQWAGASDELDARSDVFSLGMVAHELLTGKLPVKSDPRSSARKLGPELEAILCRALADSPQERYATAVELAADLRRFLAHEPLRAREAKPLYLLQKFAQRRRALTLALSGLFLMLVSGIIVSTTLTLEAQRQAGRKEKLIEFLHEILMSPNPMQSGSDVTVLEVLADSEELIRRQLDGEPEVEAEVRLTLGMLYRRLGDTKNAEPHLRNAVELFRRTRSEHEPRALRAKLELASLLVLYLEDLDEAELLIQDVLAVEEGRTPESRLNRIRALSMTASIHRERGEFERAISAYERAEVLARVLATPDDVLELSLRSFRARALAEGERFEEAQELARATLDEEFRRLGAEHRQTLISQVTLGTILLRRWQAGGGPGQLGEAEALLRGAFEGRITRLGPEHPGTLSAQQLLSEALQERGLMKEAIALQREVVEVYGRSLGLARADAVQASLRLQSMLDGPLGVEEAVSGADGDL